MKNKTISLLFLTSILWTIFTIKPYAMETTTVLVPHSQALSTINELFSLKESVPLDMFAKIMSTTISNDIEHFLTVLQSPKDCTAHQAINHEMASTVLNDYLTLFAHGHHQQNPEIISFMETLLVSFLASNNGSMRIWPFISKFYLHHGYDSRKILEFFETRPDINISDQVKILKDLIICPDQRSLHTTYLLGLMAKGKVQPHEACKILDLFDLTQLTTSDWLTIMDVIFPEPPGIDEINTTPIQDLNKKIQCLKMHYECSRLISRFENGVLPMGSLPAQNVLDAHLNYKKFKALLAYPMARHKTRIALRKAEMKFDTAMSILNHLSLFSKENQLQHHFLQKCTSYILNTSKNPSLAIPSMEHFGHLTQQARDLENFPVMTRLHHRLHHMINSPTLLPHNLVISFVASPEPCGDGIHPETFDYFMGKQYPWLSLIIPELRKRGYPVEVLNWQDSRIQWEKRSCLFIGPVWGYSKKQAKFHAWLTTIQSYNIPLINSMDFMTWNFKKTYLDDLQTAGISVIPTLIVPKESTLPLEEILIQAYEKFDTTDIILKGVVGAGGFDYLHYNADQHEKASEHLETLKAHHRGAVIQPFWKEISEKGELSFVLFGNALSHCYLKVCAPFQELVQVFYGGKSFHLSKEDLSCHSEEFFKKLQEFHPDLKITLEELCLAHGQIYDLFVSLKEFFSKMGISMPPIVRLDCIIKNKQLYIMEIEGIDPYLEMKEASCHDLTKEIINWYTNELLRQVSMHQVLRQ